MKRKMAFVDLTNFKDWPMGGMLEYELAILPYLERKQVWLSSNRIFGGIH